MSSFPRAVRFARTVYLVAGIIGLLEIAPLYFVEGLINKKQPPRSRMEFYYGFLGIAFAWQIVLW